MKKLIAITGILVLLMYFSGAVWYIPGCRSGGLCWGDYSDFKRVRAALESIEGVAIEQTWVHQDVAEENFGFYLRINNSQPIHLIFPGDNRLRRLRGPDLVKELQDVIKSKAVWVI